MKVYVAGASAELERARRAISMLELAGFEVTFDWTAPVAEHGSAHPDPDECRAYAQTDEDAVDESHLLWLLVPHADTKGAWWEAGRARAKGKLLIASGAEDDLAAMIFVQLADERFSHPIVPEQVVYSSGWTQKQRDDEDSARIARVYGAAQERADERAFAWLRGYQRFVHARVS